MFHFFGFILLNINLMLMMSSSPHNREGKQSRWMRWGWRAIVYKNYYFLLYRRAMFGCLIMHPIYSIAFNTDRYSECFHKISQINR